MIKPKKYTDPILLSIFGLFIVISIYLHFVYNYILPINYYPGLFCWIIVIGFKIYNAKKEYFLVLILLVLYSLNIINFTVVRFNVNIAGIILLVVYAAINKDMVISICRNIFIGSEEELEKKRNKMVVFYYEKFQKCETEELNEIFNNFNSYPIEAQIALNKIKKEKI
jgi:hypothetical protein